MARLQVGQVMRLGPVAAADQTGSSSHPLEVIRIALTAQLTYSELRLVDPAAGLCPLCKTAQKDMATACLCGQPPDGKRNVIPKRRPKSSGPAVGLTAHHRPPNCSETG